MIKSEILILGIILIGSLPEEILAQEYPVEIVDYSADNIGRSLVYYVKEEIRASEGFKLNYGNETRFKLIIET